MIPLRLLVTADPELPVPATHSDGIERIVALLVDGLVERGHTVRLIAHRDSRTRGTLVPYRGLDSGSPADTAANATLIARETARMRPHVVQSFDRLAYLAPILPLSVPKVMSYQRQITVRSVNWARLLAGSSIHFTGCSQHLIEAVQTLGSWRVIYNGVAVDRFRYAPRVPVDAPLVFLGRIEYSTGVHLAIAVARESGRQLVIAGNVPHAHMDYFKYQVQPHVDDRSVRYLGPVDDRQKSDLLASAAALLMPILRDEPFGIVMAEALACGTPVIGLHRGSVPEVVDDGVTGFVCDNEDEMTIAVAHLDRLSRDACRYAAEARFSDRALVDAYESFYLELSHCPASVHVGRIPVRKASPSAVKRERVR
jgi:glycosyltransferase involved in cell wall biosynthesis